MNGRLLEYSQSRAVWVGPGPARRLGSASWEGVVRLLAELGADAEGHAQAGCQDVTCRQIVDALTFYRDTLSTLQEVADGRLPYPTPEQAQLLLARAANLGEEAVAWTVRQLRFARALLD